MEVVNPGYPAISDQSVTPPIVPVKGIGDLQHPLIGSKIAGNYNKNTLFMLSFFCHECIPTGLCKVDGETGWHFSQQYYYAITS